MKVEITELAEVNSGQDNMVYVAESASDCWDETHRIAYDLVVDRDWET